MRLRLCLAFVLVVPLLAFPAHASATTDPTADGEVSKLFEELKRTMGDEAVEIARRYLGTPYVWAGASPAGFDCSGFVMYVYGRLGIVLPHNGAQLWGVGRPVQRRDLDPGDVVFFDALGHVGIYIGGGRFIHSPHSGDVVKISSFSDGWYGSTFVGGRRVWR
jgi:cell wall-associated NlpC family hydrolase